MIKCLTATLLEKMDYGCEIWGFTMIPDMVCANKLKQKIWFREMFLQCDKHSTLESSIKNTEQKLTP